MLSAPQPLGDHHQLAAFDSGEPSPDDWLTRRAARSQANSSSRTYVVCEGDTVIGCYCLAAGAVICSSVLEALSGQGRVVGGRSIHHRWGSRCDVWNTRRISTVSPRTR